MKYSLPAVLLCLCCILPAMAWENPEIPGVQYGRYEPETQVRLFGDRVNIRATPSTRGKIVATLPIASPMTVKEVKEDSLTLHGLTAPWYGIEFTGPQGKARGFVWGGLLSFLSLTDENDLFLVGVAGKPRELELRQVRGGKQVDALKFEGINLDDGGTFGYSLHGGVERLAQLPGQPRLLTVAFEYGACDYPNGAVFFTWNGRKLAPGPREIIASNEFGGSDFTLHRPGETGVPPGILKISRITREAEESGGEAKITAQSESVWTWTGEALKEVR